MGKILKIERQPIETFQGISFMQSIILAHDNVKNELYNSYINLTCDISDGIGNINVCFSDVTWEDFRLRDLVHMDVFEIANIKQDRIADFIKERLEHETYVLIFSIDEFYLTYSINHQKNHYIHDTYIYGYEKDEFMVMAYSHDKLKRLHVKLDEIEAGLYNAYLENDNIVICTLQVKGSANQLLNVDMILKNMSDYLRGVKGDDKNNNEVYGLDIYKLLENYLQIVVFADFQREVNLDLRPFRIIWEHKKVMKLRIEKINELFDIGNECVNEITEIEHNTFILYNLIIKYLISFDNKILLRAIKLLNEIADKDRHFVEAVIKRVDLIQKCHKSDAILTDQLI